MPQGVIVWYGTNPDLQFKDWAKNFTLGLWRHRKKTYGHDDYDIPNIITNYFTVLKLKQLDARKLSMYFIWYDKNLHSFNTPKL